MIGFDPEAADLRLSRDDREDAENRLLFLDRFDTSDVSECPSLTSCWGGRSLTSVTTNEEER